MVSRRVGTPLNSDKSGLDFTFFNGLLDNVSALAYSMGMKEHVREFIRDCRSRGICPQCLKPVPEGGGVGTGRIMDGLFCSFECYGAFYGEELKTNASNISRSRYNSRN